MGLFEYCDELLEKDFLDNTAFSRQYRYRVQNLLTNHWVVSQKLMAARPGWLGFINLCHRLEIRSIPTVKPLSAEEMAELYPTHRRKRFSLLGS